VNLLTSVTKGIKIVNELLENYKISGSKDEAIGPSNMMNEMMEFSRQGFDEEELLNQLSRGGSRHFM